LAGLPAYTQLNQPGAGETPYIPPAEGISKLTDDLGYKPGIG